MRLLCKNRKVVITTLLFVIIGGFFIVPTIYEKRLSITRSPVFSHVIPFYRSFRKLPDVFFLPISLFSKSKLETFELVIKPSDIQVMNAALPQDPFGDTFLDDKYKKWVSANFFADGYSDKVKVRYRGNQNGHWNSYQKSYLIKFPKDNLFRGMRELTFIISSDRRYLTTSLNNYRARKLGFIVPEEGFVKLQLNGADHGIYITLEHWSQEWIEKAGIETTSILFGTPDAIELDRVPLYSDEGITYWKALNMEQPLLVFESAKVISEIVQHADVETFEKLIPQIIDLDLFYARDILFILSGGQHLSNSVNANNAIFYFDTLEGRFKPIPYNVSLWEPEAGIFPGTPTDLQKRIWEIPKFKEARARLFHSYVEENEKDDLDFLEDWSKTMNKEFYKDSAKIDNNFIYLSKINNFKDLISGYFRDPNNKANDVDSPSAREERNLEFSGSFVYLPETILSPREFVNTHPGFVLRGNEIFLPSGPHFFSRDIIVPVNTKLTISPVATLLMGEGVSLVSYSPVEAQGTAYQPIRIIATNKDKPWGVFAIINTESESSSLRHLYVSNGKDDTINGVYFSGMLAMHNADGEILNSRIENAHADDGVNIKKGEVLVQGNVFSNNSSDGIDVDFARGSTALIDNQFFDNGGDAIDLSWSELLIDGNVIVGCLDKGISVGERSKPIVSKNLIAQCAIGIASKDSSVVTADNNIFIGNRVAVSAYQKKSIYGGVEALISGGTFWGNARNIRVDNLSVIELDGVSETEPDLSLFPRFIQEKILQ